MKAIDKRRLTICLLSFIFLIYILILALFKETNFFDTLYIYRTDTLTKVFNIITKLGNWYTLILITLAFLLLKDKSKFKYISINLLTSSLLNLGLKFIFRRPRPALNLIGATGFSFPSGHSMVSMSFYGFLIYMLLKSKNSNILKIIGTVFLLMIILMIGFSRVYLGAHYMTDVLGGFLVGIIYLLIFTLIIKKGGKKDEKN